MSLGNRTIVQPCAVGELADDLPRLSINDEQVPPVFVDIIHGLNDVLLIIGESSIKDTSTFITVDASTSRLDNCSWLFLPDAA